MDGLVLQALPAPRENRGPVENRVQPALLGLRGNQVLRGRQEGQGISSALFPLRLSWERRECP